MRLKISRTEGIRLYVSKRRYIKVHNVLLLLGGLFLAIFIGVNAYRGFTYSCSCADTITAREANNTVVEETNSSEEVTEQVSTEITLGEQEPEEKAEQKAEEKTEQELEKRATEAEKTEVIYDGVCAQYYDMVDKYDWDTEIMLAIMYAESNCRANLDNTGLNKDGSVDYGLFQINSIHGYDKNDLMDPAFNIDVAYKIYKSQGLRAWSVYNSGKYLNYIS